MHAHTLIAVSDLLARKQIEHHENSIGNPDAYVLNCVQKTDSTRQAKGN